jgi:hypothetical protein
LFTDGKIWEKTEGRLMIPLARTDGGVSLHGIRIDAACWSRNASLKWDLRESAIQVQIQELSLLVLSNLCQAVHGVEPNQSIKKNQSVVQ